MNRAEMFKTAVKCVCCDREQDYGDPKISFEKIAEYWTTYCGYKFTPVDVAVMMILFKVSRMTTGQAKIDNWIDIMGYAACGGEVEAVEISENCD